MSLELQLKEKINQYFDEEPIIVPTLYEFISWLYDQAFILDQQHVNSEISLEIEASSQVMAKAKKYVNDLKGSFVIQNNI